MTIHEVLDLLTVQLEKELPFVAYRKADEDLMHVLLQKDKTLYTTTDYKTSGFVFAPFNAVQQQTLLIPLSKSRSYNALVTEEIEEEYTTKVFSKIALDKTCQEKYTTIIKKAITEINTSCCEKIVLSRKEKISISNIKAITILKRLLVKYPKAFVYCWYHPAVGLWLGATPETLLTIAKDRFFTMALAGTQPNVTRDHQNIIWGQKEITEQQMVSDYIVKQLRGFTKTVNRSDTYTHMAGTVLHLRTDIKGAITEHTNIADIIAALHPTPAVCGLPQQHAKSFILEHEGYDRKFYTGFLGMVESNDTHHINANLYVNLRCMEIISNTAILYIGGGITKDSDPKKEWKETIKKSETIKNVL